MHERIKSINNDVLQSFQDLQGAIEQALKLPDEGRTSRFREVAARIQTSKTTLRTLDMALTPFLLEVGSLQTDPGVYPECVAVGNDGGFFASGVLLSENWLLTASHASDAKKMFAGLDVNVASGVYEMSLVDQRDLLAVFRVANFPGQIQVPALPSDDLRIDSGTPLRVVAFGDTSRSAGYGEQREAQFRVDDAYDVRIYASSSSGLCGGDSGGPAFYDDKKSPRLLLGICDSMVGDCGSGGIFATLVGHAGWLADVTKLPFTPRNSFGATS